MTTPLATPGRRIRYPAMLVAVLLLLVVGASVIFVARQFIDSARWVSHTHATIEQITAIYSRVKDVESAQRGYVLTGEVDYLAQLQLAKPEIAVRANDVVTLVQDNTAQEERAMQLATLSERRIAISDEVVRLYQQEGFERAQREIATNHGKDVMSQIAQLTHTMEAEERRLLVARDAASDRSATRLQVAAVLGIGLSLVLIGIVFRWMVGENRVRRRAEQQAAASRQQLAGSVEELRLAGDRLHELRRGASMLQSCRSVEEAMGVARQSFLHLFPDVAGAIYLTRASQNLTELRVSWGDVPCPPAQVMAPNDCWAVRRGQPYAVNDNRAETVCGHVHADPAMPVFSTNCLPLVARGETLGLVHLCGPDGRAVENAEIALAATEQLSLALSNLQLQESLRVQSIRDPLTGLFNRRYLEESLEREIARCVRRNMPMSVLMLDLDHFKRFNDSHGHDGGDALLAQFGRLLDSLCRSEDIACRFGGEEFTMILPEAGIDVARTRAEAIRVATSELQVMHLRRNLGPVTCSIGVASFPLHAETGAMLVKAADAALYRAKAEGRDRVGVA